MRPGIFKYSAQKISKGGPPPLALKICAPDKRKRPVEINPALFLLLSQPEKRRKNLNWTFSFCPILLGPEGWRDGHNFCLRERGDINRDCCSHVFWGETGPSPSLFTLRLPVGEAVNSGPGMNFPLSESEKGGMERPFSPSSSSSSSSFRCTAT